MGPTPGGADDLNDLPPDERPYGTRPYGTRPYGTRPYGTRPYGTRPYGTRPYGTRPYGTRPYGTRPYGTRPAEGDDNAFDPAEWSEDVAELFMARSALVRLGACLVTGPEYIDVPAVNAGAPPLYGAKPIGYVAVLPLWLKRYELTWSVVLPDGPAGSPAPPQEVAWALKDEIARALALSADRAFLSGNGKGRPEGIAARVPDLGPVGNAEQRLRAMVRSLRDARQDAFERAGWVLPPRAFASIENVDANNLERHPGRLLEHDGAGGGLLLGYPFAVSAAAKRVFFSSDWGEAWIGAYPGVVRIDVSTDTRFENAQTVVRAVLHHDFLLRRKEVFVHATI